MAKKSSSSTSASVQTVDTNTIDVNLAKQVTVQSPTPAPTEAPTPAPTKAPKEDSTVKKDDGISVPAFDKKDTLSYKLKNACGVRYDLDKMVDDCDGDSTKLKQAYDKVMWHLGRIHSCEDSTHTSHVGRYDSKGNPSAIVKELKTLFSQK